MGATGCGATGGAAGGAALDICCEYGNTVGSPPGAACVAWAMGAAGIFGATICVATTCDAIFWAAGIAPAFIICVPAFTGAAAAGCGTVASAAEICA